MTVLIKSDFPKCSTCGRYHRPIEKKTIILGYESHPEREIKFSKIPIVQAEPDNWGMLTFYCEYCKTEHRHGIGEGDRAAHCSRTLHKRGREIPSNSPFIECGYILKASDPEYASKIPEYEKLVEEDSRAKNYAHHLRPVTSSEMNQIIEAKFTRYLNATSSNIRLQNAFYQYCNHQKKPFARIENLADYSRIDIDCITASAYDQIGQEEALKIVEESVKLIPESHNKEYYCSPMIVLFNTNKEKAESIIQKLLAVWDNHHNIT